MIVAKPTPEKIANALDKAADVLDRVGLHRYDMWDKAQEAQGTPRAKCRQCAMGVISTAVLGDPLASTSPASVTLWIAAIAEVEKRYTNGRYPHIAAWSDVSTQAQVTAAFRATASELRHGGAQ